MITLKLGLYYYFKAWIRNHDQVFEPYTDSMKELYRVVSLKNEVKEENLIT